MRRTGTMRALLAVATASTAFAVLSAVGSGQDGVRLTLPTVTELEYPLVQVVANVEDTTATDPGGLAKENFIATVNGQPATVNSAELASSQTIPLDVLLLIDTSGSTEGEGLAQAKSAAVSFIRGLAPEDCVAVMRFANSVTLQQDYTTDKEAAIAAINALTSSGQTETYKATDAAVRQAATSTSLRRAMILLTDGAADSIVTGITSQDALSTAALSNVPVFTIAQGAAIEDSSFLVELARASNGQYLEAPGPSDLQGVYAGIGRILQNQYLVTIDAASAAGLPQSTIGLQVTSGGRVGSATTEFVPGPGFVVPSVLLTGIAAGESLTEPRDITVTTAGPQPITKAAFYVDDVNVFETTEAPFTFTYDPDKFGESSHTLRVAATVGDRIIDGEELSFASVPTNPVAIPDPSASTDEGGGLPVLPIAAIVAVVALIGIGYAVIQRIRTTSGPTLAMVSPDQRVTPWTGQHRTVSRAPQTVEADETNEPPTPAVVQEIGEPLGVLISRSGSDAGVLYPVGGKPVSLGNGDTCAVRIDDSSLASEEARLWIRKGTLMYHRMTRLTTIAFEGAAGGWQMLDPGESFSIGAHTFEFKLLPEGVPIDEALAAMRPPTAPAPPQTRPEGVPNILREKPEPGAPTPMTLPQPGMASSDRPQRLTEMMPRDMGFGHQDVDAPDEQAS